MKYLLVLFVLFCSGTVFSQQLVLFADSLEEKGEVHKIKNNVFMNSNKNGRPLGNILVKNYKKQTKDFNLRDKNNTEIFRNASLLSWFLKGEEHIEHHLTEEYFSYDVHKNEKFIAKVASKRYSQKESRVLNTEKHGTFTDLNDGTSFINTDIFIGEELKPCQFDWTIQNNSNTNIEGTALFGNDTLQIRVTRKAKKYTVFGVEIVKNNRVIAGVQLRGPTYFLVANGLDKELEALVYAMLSTIYITAENSNPNFSVQYH